MEPPPTRAKETLRLEDGRLWFHHAPQRKKAKEAKAGEKAQKKLEAKAAFNADQTPAEERGSEERLLPPQG